MIKSQSSEHGENSQYSSPLPSERSEQPGKGPGVRPVDTSKSPRATLRPVPVNSVVLQDAFWKPRIDINREITLPAQLKQCEETGRINNFRRASGKKQIDFQGIFFNDSDVYKLLEAMAFSLATYPDPQLDADADAVIQEVADAQDANGYLNTYFMFERAKDRFTNLKDMHEIYCAGHLFQAAVAHYRATGKTTLLTVATRLADYIDSVFGPEPEKRIGACGHEEAEMGLVELYRVTGESRYLKLARFMIEARGRKPGIFNNSAYHQDHLPFVEQNRFTGHAVRHLYLACGATDVATELADTDYEPALNALWDNLTQKQMYVTGGVGSRYEGEAFGNDYELPNDRAYTETCAAIGSVMWNWRMLLLTGEARFADVLETTLYNGVLSGLSRDGAHYFYQNPLADRGQHRRQAWFGCACCPPNVARLLASLPGYFYSTTTDTIVAHLYAASDSTMTTPVGGTVRLIQKTDYPWSGDVEITVAETSGPPVNLMVRIPAWAHNACVIADGHELAGVTPGTYLSVGALQAGSIVHLSFPMPIERIQTNPRVIGNLRRVALKRGPLVYCLEQIDHPDADVWDIALPDDSHLTAEHRPELLGGVTVITGAATAGDVFEEEPLYKPLSTPAPPRETAITAIPYFAWANREVGPMTVWISRGDSR